MGKKSGNREKLHLKRFLSAKCLLLSKININFAGWKEGERNEIKKQITESKFYV